MGLAVTGLALPERGRAEEAPQTVYKLGEVVVTATRTEKEAVSAPGSVSVVSKQDIDDRNIETLDEALNTTVGVFDDSKGKGLMGTTASVSMRGMSSDKRVLFLLDGMPLNDAYTGGVNYQLQSVDNIDQIEVVKGAGSSLYGGNAMAGVVNIITRMPEKREMTLKTGYGSSWDRGEALDDLEKLYLSYGDKLRDKLSLFASYGYKGTNGYATGLNVQSKDPSLSGLSGALPTTNTAGEPRFLIGDSGDNTWRDDQLALKGAYDISSKTKATLSFLRSSYDYGYDEPHSYLRNAAGDEVWTYSTVKENSFLSGDGGKVQNIYSGSLETKLPHDVQAKLSLGYLDISDNWYVTKGSTAATTRAGGPGTLSETPSSNAYADLQFTLPAGQRQIITVGGAYRAGQADTEEHSLSDWHDEGSKLALTYEAGGKDRIYALFLQDEIAILDNLTAYLGARQDWWQASDGYADTDGSGAAPRTSYDGKDDSALSPKAALVYTPFSATTIRASIGQAFRPPSVYDLYRTWVSSTGTTYAGNPNLTPETVTSWEVGGEQGLWEGMTMKATYFENEMEDMIYRKTVTPTRQENINAGKARSRGLELEAEQRFDFGLTLFANFTYTDSRMLENEAAPGSVGKQLLQVPRRMANAGARYHRGPYTASLIGRYVGKRYGNDTNTDIVSGVYTSYAPYTTVDAKASYQINQYAEVSLSVDNIFAEEYFGYYPATGRAWFSELTFRF